MSNNKKPRLISVEFSRWPWQQGYNWKGMTNNTAPLNDGARFGGGWKYKLGLATAGWYDGRITFIADLLFGMARLVIFTPARLRKEKAEWVRKEEAAAEEVTAKAARAEEERQRKELHDRANLLANHRHVWEEKDRVFRERLIAQFTHQLGIHASLRSHYNLADTVLSDRWTAENKFMRRMINQIDPKHPEGMDENFIQIVDNDLPF